MRRVEQVMQFQANWLRDHPLAKDIIVNRERPVHRRLRYRGEEPPESESLPHIDVSRLMQAFGAGFITVIRMIYEAQVPLFVTAYRTSMRWRILESDFPKLWDMHGTVAAFKARRGHLEREPLSSPCPRCGKSGLQHRKGKSRAGKQVTQCGHCRRYYTHNGSRQPPISTPCPRCGVQGPQHRKGKRQCGSQIVFCLHCRRHYTIRPPVTNHVRRSRSQQMTRIEQIRQFKEKSAAEHPGRDSIVIEEPPGAPKSEEPCISMRRLRALLGVAYKGALRILQDESVMFKIRHEGTRVRYAIPASAVPGLIERHATEQARARRRERPFLRRGEPVSESCRRCGKIGGQWRQRVGTDGMIRAFCSGCRKTYVTDKRYDGTTLTCPKCAATERQYRKQARFGSSSLILICGPCGAHYTLKGLPRKPSTTRIARPTRKASGPSARQLEEIEHQRAIDDFFRRGGVASPEDEPQESHPASSAPFASESAESSSKQPVPV